MVKVLFADTSFIIRKGFSALLEEFSEINAVKAVACRRECLEVAQEIMPDLVLINTAFFSVDDMNSFRKLLPESTHVLYLFNTMLPDDAPANQLSIFESKASLIDKISNVLQKISTTSPVEDSEELSPREKLILKQVALGLTNKEIGAKLFISAHTVITHRKNITRKLGIKTVSGLTVYAIINNLIQMEDIS